MDQIYLEQLVEERLSIRAIGERTGLAYSTIRYWLRKYNLKTKIGPNSDTPKDLINSRLCSTCGETDPKKFYGHKRHICAKCQNKYNTERGNINRRNALEYLGGKCINCGFDRYKSALSIHHLDPSKKDPAFSSCYGWAWSRLKQELDLCVLLCANCHTAVHANELNVDAAVMNFKSSQSDQKRSGLDDR